MIDVTVVMPAYNSAQFIADSIQSVRDQSFHAWELIVVDDGSSDNTRTVVARQGRDEPRLRLVELSSNRGAAVARNHAIALARGRFIAFLDSDDTWRPDKLAKQVRMLSEHDAVLVFSDYYVAYGKEKRPHRVVRSPSTLTYSNLLMGDPVGCLTVMYDTKKTGRVFMPELKMRQDWGLWLCLLEAGGHGTGIPEPLATLRVHEGSLSSNKAKAVYYNYRVLRTVGRLGHIRAVVGTAAHLLGALGRRMPRTR